MLPPRQERGESASLFNTLELRDNGLWATGIDWTPAARQMIESKEYRYVSPTFDYDRKTGEITYILNIALTNTPALDGMAALAAANLRVALSHQSPSETRMDELLERLRYLLDLPLTATTDDIVAELDKVKVMIASGEGATAASVSLVGHLTALNTVLNTALTDAKKSGSATDPTKFVPMDQFVALQNQFAALSRAQEDRERTGLMDAALADGRILDVQKDYWSKQPLTALKAFLDVAKPLAALSRMQSGGKEPGDSVTGLSAEQLAISKSLGLDAAAFAKSLGKGA